VDVQGWGNELDLARIRFDSPHPLESAAECDSGRSVRMHATWCGDVDVRAI